MAQFPLSRSFAVVAFPLTLVLLAAACTGKGKPGEDREVEELTFTNTDPGRSMFEWRAEPDELTTAPVSLTADDGTGLTLTAMDARVVLEDPLAFTELTLTFHNPEDRVREGRFEITLPDGAAISRFAMLIDDEWQEAEVVEKQAARVAYEDFLHRRQDPALLEQDAGNKFRARVFPIPARANKQLKIAFSSELRSSKQPYQMLLAGLPRMQTFDVDVAVVRPGAASMGSSLGGRASNVEHLTIHERDFVPRSDLEVRFEREVVERGLRSQTLAVGRIAPVVDTAPEPIEGLTILLDTSASRALGFDGQLDRLGELLAALSDEADFPIDVFCFDQTLERVYRGDARGFGSDARAKIRARQMLGASDLAGALTELARPTSGPLQSRVLVITDGIITAGEDGHDALREAVAALSERGVERLDALVDGGIKDELTLTALTTAGLARDGVVADARLTPASLASKLGSATRSGIEVAVEGAEWVWPRTLNGYQPGDEVLIYAKLPASEPMIVELRDGDAVRRIGVPTRAAQGPLLERAWTRAKIEQMSAAYREMSAAEDKAVARDEIVALSTKNRVMSQFTSLLVLETEADYARFNIDRRALADILTVGPSGIELIDRSLPPWLVMLEPEPEREPELAGPRGGGDDRHEGAEGRMGRATAGSRAGLYAMRGPRDAIPQMARNFDPDMAQRSAGILGVMQEQGGQFLASPYGGAFAVGNDDEDVWGGLTGGEVGEAYGVGGLGLIGSGRGGGGMGEAGLLGSGYGRGSGAGFGGRGRRVPQVRQAKATVKGNLDRDIIRRIVRAHINEVRSCYNAALTRNPSVRGRISINFVIDGTGKVGSSVVQENQTPDSSLGNCMAKAVKRWRFPKPRGGGNVLVTYPFVLSSDGSGPPPSVGHDWREDLVPIQKPPTEEPWTGRFAEIMERIANKELELALSEAQQWRESEPGSELALLALGEAAEANARIELAARAYGSLIDLFPSRADIRRMAGERLERLALVQPSDELARASAQAALELAVDTYREAVEQRPDHPSSHRLYAYALVKAGRHEDALTAIIAGITRSYPGGRFAGVDEILREDAGLIAAAWIAAKPGDDERVRQLLEQHQLALATRPSTRFVINWETDANDVDFHIHDNQGGHAYYSSKELASGGRLYADVTTGYGPECFTIEGTPKAGPYKLQAHYFSMGPMGYGMGKLEILRHDGHGKLEFEERPFVIMRDRAYVDLGQG